MANVKLFASGYDGKTRESLSEKRNLLALAEHAYAYDVQGDASSDGTLLFSVELPAKTYLLVLGYMHYNAATELVLSTKSTVDVSVETQLIRFDKDVQYRADQFHVLAYNDSTVVKYVNCKMPELHENAANNGTSVYAGADLWYVIEDYIE